ncbi:sugar ABC transporter ATP-binding protein [Mesorhizobium sp. BAC0120]|uniref:sugar ABC transporter ATP-binding protein n=1 Tax=Mesorhizobium sp. BAC0120 TaxID=3090670 RepID=UPI00298BDE80|nr:sugar ABC transporter ATP-binding protein [Mesorhizobium sp. BAC0120]MDW6026167.1 sugar ABC transporter ATP-binding protein [Mesorhizobium sp. BAC0120]
MSEAGDPLLELHAVGKRFPGAVALSDVSLSINRGETHILLGENGAGKSTLIKLLAGVYAPDDGEIRFEGQPYRPSSPHGASAAGIRVVHQELNLMQHLSIAENLMLEKLPSKYGLVQRSKLRAKASALLEEVGLSVDPRLRVSALGIAQMQLVEIAKALGYESKLLILDEPTATLTPPEINRLFQIIKRLKAKGVTIIYISHRLHEIFEIGDRVTVLRNGRLMLTRALEGFAIEDIVRTMVGRRMENQLVFREDVALGDELLRVRNLKRNNRAPEVSFDVRRGEIVGVAGLVGSGRTETVRAIFGADPKAGGEVWLSGHKAEVRSPKMAVKSGLGLATEDRKEQGLLLDLSCEANITITDPQKVARVGLLDRTAEARFASDLFGKLRVKAKSTKQIIRHLSGGNQQKIVLAKWLFRGSDMLILDEPTRGVDVGAKHEIYELLWMLAAQGKGILMISSEIPELIGVCHRILVFSKGKIVGELARPEFDQEKILSLAFQEHIQ